MRIGIESHWANQVPEKYDNKPTTYDHMSPISKRETKDGPCQQKAGGGNTIYQSIESQYGLSYEAKRKNDAKRPKEPKHDPEIRDQCAFDQARSLRVAHVSDQPVGSGNEYNSCQD